MSWFIPAYSYGSPATMVIPERHRATKAWLEPVEVRDEIDELVNWQLAQDH